MSSSDLDMSSRRHDNLTNADLIRTIVKTVLKHFKNSKLYSALSNIGRGRSSICGRSAFKVPRAVYLIEDEEEMSGPRQEGRGTWGLNIVGMFLAKFKFWGEDGGVDMGEDTEDHDGDELSEDDMREQEGQGFSCDEYCRVITPTIHLNRLANAYHYVPPISDDRNLA
jgi:hypothetical protein